MKIKDYKNNEAIILLPIILLVLILLIGVGFINSREEKNDAQLYGVEVALEQVKKEMSSRFDQELVNSLEVASIDTIRERGQDLYLDVTLSIADLEEVFLNYYEILIREELWDREDPDFHIERAFQQAVDRSGAFEFSVPEEIRLRETDQGSWQVQNPEAMDVELPARIKGSLKREVQWTRDRFYDFAIPRSFYIPGEEESFEELYEVLEQELYNHLTYRSEVVEEDGVREIQFQAVEGGMSKVMNQFIEEGEEHLGQDVYGIEDFLEITTDTFLTALKTAEPTYHPLSQRVITFEEEPLGFYIEESRMLPQEREIFFRQDGKGFQSLWDSAQSIGFGLGEIWNQEIMEIKFPNVDQVYQWKELGDYGLMVYLDDQQRKIALLDLAAGQWLEEHELGTMDQEYLNDPHHYYLERSMLVDGNVGALIYPVASNDGRNIHERGREIFIFEVVDGSIKEIMKTRDANLSPQEIILYEEEVYLKQSLRNEEGKSIHQIIKPRTGEVIFEVRDLPETDPYQEEVKYSPRYLSRTLEGGRFVLYYMDHGSGLHDYYSNLYHEIFTRSPEEVYEEAEAFVAHENQMYLYDLKKEEVVLDARSVELEHLDTNQVVPLTDEQVMVFSKHHGWWLLDGVEGESYFQVKGSFEAFSNEKSPIISFNSETPKETAAHLTWGEVFGEDLVYLRSSRFFDEGMEKNSFWYLSGDQLQPLLEISKYVGSPYEYDPSSLSNWEIEYDPVLNKLIVTRENWEEGVEEAWLYSIDQEAYRKITSPQAIKDIQELNKVPWFHLETHVQVDREKYDFTMGTFLIGRNPEGTPLKDFRNQGFGLLKEGTRHWGYEPEKDLMYMEGFGTNDAEADPIEFVRVNGFVGFDMDHEKERISILTKTGYHVYELKGFLQILQDLL